MMTQMGFQKGGSGRWSKARNGDIAMGFAFDIVNNPSDRFTSAQVTVSSYKLQSLQDPTDSLGMTIPYICISISEDPSTGSRLDYPETEEMALVLSETIVAATRKIVEELEWINDGDDVLSYIHKNPASSTVSNNILVYISGLLTGTISHDQYPNWQTFAEHCAKNDTAQN